MTTTARRRKNQTSRVSVEHGDRSQVWAPLPAARLPDHEQISRDCAHRAAWYSRSAFWRDGVVGRRKRPTTKPAVPKQRELFA